MASAANAKMNKQLKNTLKGNTERVVDLVWSDASNSLLSVDEMGHVTNWDLNAATRRFEHDAGGPIKQLVWSPEGTHLAWINSEGKPQLLLVKADASGLRTVTCHISSLHSVAWLANTIFS